MRYLLVILGAFFSTTCLSASKSDATIAAAMGEAYVKEQIKQQLGNYLNNHPEIIFSSNPNIGTQSMRVIGQGLAAYNFITAKTDKDRGFAAAAFLVPDPTTALALFALQMADTMISMRHERDLARTYQEIASIKLETVSVLAKVYTAELNYQHSIVAQFDAAMTDLDELEHRLKMNQVFIGLQKDSSAALNFNAEDITQAIDIIFRFEDVVSELETAMNLVEVRVDLAGLGFKNNLLEWRTFVEKQKASRLNIAATKQSFLNIFKAVSAQAWMQEADSHIAERLSKLDMYSICVKAINQFTTDQLLKRESEVDLGFLNSCGEHFALTWEI